jgi:hypothetical protein
MRRRNIWVCAFACSAATLTISTVHAGYPPSWRMYAGMPGLYVALIAGWFGIAQTRPSIYILAFLINGLVYYALIRFILVLANLRS